MALVILNDPYSFSRVLPLAMNRAEVKSSTVSHLVEELSVSY